jgi:hypothetical protein
MADTGHAGIKMEQDNSIRMIGIILEVGRMESSRSIHIEVGNINRYVMKGGIAGCRRLKTGAVLPGSRAAPGNRYPVRR